MKSNFFKNGKEGMFELLHDKRIIKIIYNSEEE